MFLLVVTIFQFSQVKGVDSGQYFGLKVLVRSKCCLLRLQYIIGIFNTPMHSGFYFYFFPANFVNDFVNDSLLSYTLHSAFKATGDIIQHADEFIFIYLAM